MEVDTAFLKLALTWLATEGASTASSYILEKVKKFQSLGATAKFLVGYLVTGLIGEAAFFAMMGMQYVPVPIGYIKWIETVVGVAAVAIGLPQIIHRLPSLIRKDRGDS